MMTSPTPEPIPERTDDEAAPPFGRTSPAAPIFVGLCAGLVLAAWLDSDSIHRARGVCRAERLIVALDEAARVEELAVHHGEVVLPGQPLLRWTDLELEAEIARRQRCVDDLTSRLAAAEAKYDAELSRRMATLDGAIRSELAGDFRRSSGAATPVAFSVNGRYQRRHELERQRLELPSRLPGELGIPALRWEVAAAEASLAELRSQGAWRMLLAPAAGSVVGIDVRRGTELPAGSTAITLSVPGRPRILAELPAAKAECLAAGDRVEIIIGHGPPLAATVAELRPGRHVAGTASAAADRGYVTAGFVPRDPAEWPTIRDGSKVTVIWRH